MSASFDERASGRRRIVRRRKRQFQKGHREMRAFCAFLVVAALVMMYPVNSASAQGKYRDPGLKKVIQVAIVVRDIEASSKRWSELLGMPVPRSRQPGRAMKSRWCTAASLPKDRPNSHSSIWDRSSWNSSSLSGRVPAGRNTSTRRVRAFSTLDSRWWIPIRPHKRLKKQGCPSFTRGGTIQTTGLTYTSTAWMPLGVVIELLHSDSR